MGSRGGARIGAGRKPSNPLFKKIPVGYKLPFWLVAWMRDQEPSNAKLIEDAMIEKYKLSPPKTGD